MATTIVIVRDEAVLYSLVDSDVLAPGEPAVLILDRRERERRQTDGQPVGQDRRRGDRRMNRSGEEQLRRDGYAVIRPRS